MQWNYGNILSYIKDQISIGGSFSSDQEAVLKNLINAKLDILALSFPIDELKVPNYFLQSPADYDTGTISATNASTAITGSGTTWTYKMKGRKIRINDGLDYYIVKDVASTTSITLDRKYLGDTASGLSYTIFENGLDLPINYNWIKGVFIFNSRWKPLTSKTWDWIESLDIGLTHTGTPEDYAETGRKTVREPYTGTLTADAGSSTTITDSALLSDEDDYYNDWTLVNETAGGTSRISDYDGSSKIITLQEAITGQAAGDKYYIFSDFKQLVLYRRYTEEKNVLIKYYKKHSLLINDYDVPEVPDDFLNWLTGAVLEVWYGKDELARKWAAVRQGEENKLKGKYNKKIDEQQKQGAREITAGKRLMSFEVSD